MCSLLWHCLSPLPESLSHEPWEVSVVPNSVLTYSHILGHADSCEQFGIDRLYMSIRQNSRRYDIVRIMSTYNEQYLDQLRVGVEGLANLSEGGDLRRGKYTMHPDWEIFFEKNGTHYLHEGDAEFWL